MGEGGDAGLQLGAATAAVAVGAAGTVGASAAAAPRLGAAAAMGLQAKEMCWPSGRFSTLNRAH